MGSAPTGTHIPACLPCLPGCPPSQAVNLHRGALPGPPCILHSCPACPPRCPPLQVYCLDCQFINEMPKFIAGSLQALSAMVQVRARAALLVRIRAALGGAPVHSTPAVDCLVGPPGGCFPALQLELPHVNVLTKVDLCKDKVGGCCRATQCAPAALLVK